MIILGDIGNTETKICIVKDNKIIKKFLIPSKGKKLRILNKHFKKFVSACEFEHYPFEKPFHDIYKKELCISPMPALAVHFTNINSIYGLSPLIDYEKLWKENKI